MPHTDNNLLAHLPPDDFDLFSHRLRTTDLKQGSDLLAAGDPIRNIYFPHSGIISLVVRLRTGGVIEAAMVGRDSFSVLQPPLTARSAYMTPSFSLCVGHDGRTPGA